LRNHTAMRLACFFFRESAFVVAAAAFSAA
jgi:hypothetical protein